MQHPDNDHSGAGSLALAGAVFATRGANFDKAIQIITIIWMAWSIVATRTWKLQPRTTILELLQNQGLSTLTAPVCAPRVVPGTDPQGPVALTPPIHITAEDARCLRYSVPAPTAHAVTKVRETRSAYADEAGSLHYFTKSETVPPLLAKPSIPEDIGLFKDIRHSNRRERWEAEILWNIVENHENVLADLHESANFLVAHDFYSASRSARRR